jgi:hypothetical protein
MAATRLRRDARRFLVPALAFSQDHRSPLVPLRQGQIRDPSCRSIHRPVDQGTESPTTRPEECDCCPRHQEGRLAQSQDACTRPSATSHPTSSKPSTTRATKRHPNRRCNPHRSGKQPGTVQSRRGVDSWTSPYTHQSMSDGTRFRSRARSNVLSMPPSADSPQGKEGLK